ncbi:MAG: hypothetical protein J6D52_04685, partial [Clostridia bacterium]|nr:hypothetical protein [Clostridia bacterium]
LHCGAAQEYFPVESQDNSVVDAVPKKKKFPFKIWGPVVAGILVVAVAASTWFIFDPFGIKDSKDSKKSKKVSENSASYSNLVTAMSDTFSKGSFSFNIEAGLEMGRESMDISAECRAITNEDTLLETLWVDMDLEGDIEGESMDLGADVLIYDNKMYLYSNGTALIQEFNLESIMSAFYKQVEIPDNVNLDDFTWEDFYDMLDEMGVLEDFEKEIDTKKFENACVDALSIIESKIKLADKSGKSVYTFDVNLNDLVEEILEEFKDAVKDEDDFAEIEEGIKEIPNIDVLFEITVTNEYVSGMKFEISSTDFEMYFNFNIFDVGTTKVKQSEIDDFVEKCEDNYTDYDNYYSDEHYYEDDYYMDNYVVGL